MKGCKRRARQIALTGARQSWATPALRAPAPAQDRQGLSGRAASGAVPRLQPLPREDVPA